MDISESSKNNSFVDNEKFISENISITDKIKTNLYKAIVRIECPDNNKKYGSGFFMNIIINDKKYKYLITFRQVIYEDNEDVNTIKNIILYYGEKESEKNINIKLDKSKRNIKVQYNLDIISLLKLDKFLLLQK